MSSQVGPAVVSSIANTHTDNTNSDASYSFNIDTDSYKRHESSDTNGNIKGQYSYLSTIGGNHQVNYKAGSETGFVASVDNGKVGIPAVSSNLEGAEISSGDASYNFQYSSKGHSRNEESDNGGNVKGSYSYIGGDGVERKVDYEAGGDKGFVIKGVTSNQVNGYDVFSAGRIQGSNSGYGNLVVNSVAVDGNSGSQSGAYSFGYNAENHDRQESADEGGNVQGNYSFVSMDDGVRRTVTYKAGAGKGFVAQGAHLPAPQNPSSTAYSSVVNSYPSLSYSSLVSVPISPVVSQTNTYSGQYIAPSSPVQTPVIIQTEPSGQSGEKSDGSYSFSYETDDQARQESSDSNGNVQGSYSFIAKDDGLRRTVNYEAGAQRGYKATASHIPSVQISQVNAKLSHKVNNLNGVQAQSYDVGKTSDGSYSFAYETDDQSRKESADSNGNVQGSYSFVASNDGIRRTVNYEATAGLGFLARGSHLPAPTNSAVENQQSLIKNSVYNAEQNDLSKDNAYSYSYKTDSSSKQETSDAQGNVVGAFSYIGGDGINRNVQYTAGSQGFVATGEHLPRQNAFGFAQLSQIGSNSNNLDLTKSEGLNSFAKQNTQTVGNDHSYSYSYNTDSSSKQETSDAQGNVVGSFNFIAGDGINRNVKYTANSQGFIASGEHLPQQSSSVQSSNIGSSIPSQTHISSYSSINTGQHSGKAALSDYTVQTYLPPNNHNKYGYIYDSKL